VAKRTGVPGGHLSGEGRVFARGTRPGAVDVRHSAAAGDARHERRLARRAARTRSRHQRLAPRALHHAAAAGRVPHSKLGEQLHPQLLVLFPTRFSNLNRKLKKSH